MGKRTPLFAEHESDGARIVDFAGWDMPVDYGSQIAEHRAVRASAGMFDVSHMVVVDISGPGARDYLRTLWANDVAKADAPGKAIYTCMCNEDGGVIDDLIAYHVGDGHYRGVVNAATADKDLAWMRAQAADFAVDVARREDMAIIAVQGPEARAKVQQVLSPALAAAAGELRPFYAAFADDWLVGRTGYTGEDGYECLLPATAAPDFWRALKELGVRPVGLGARDTLRLEAGLCLYGQDMDENTSPLAAGLGWTVAFQPVDRPFIGRGALETERDHREFELVGVVLEARGVMRHGQAVCRTEAEGEGVVTSGSYSPTLDRSIGLARVPRGWRNATELTVAIRQRWQAARVVSYPFVRNGKVCVTL